MYKIVLKILSITLLFTIVAVGSTHIEKLIILDYLENPDRAQELIKKAEKTIVSDTILSKMNIPKQKMPKVIKEGKEYIVVFGPFPNNKKLAILYFRIKKLFPNAILVSLIASSNTNQVENHVVYSNENNSPNEDWTLWIALFALALTGVLALFFSSLQINRIMRQNNIMRKRQEEMESKQHELFSKLGENIYTMSRNIIKNTHKVISDIGDEKAPPELKEMVITENRILNTTNNLLEFLKIKAKKIKIDHKQFKINNMLDDVVGSFVGKFPQEDLELVLDIDHALPIYAVGDFTNIVNVLRNLLEHQFAIMERGEVVLHISMEKNQENNKLKILIMPYGVIREENINLENYFIPDTLSDSSKFNTLGLFVAYELVGLMNGEISAKKREDGVTFLDLSIPVDVIKEERRKYRLPSKSYTQKSVYITNRHYHASLAQKNLFEYFKHKVTIDSADKFIKERPNLSEYDIILIDSDLIYPGFDTYIEMLRDKYNVKTVCMQNILQGISPSIYSYLFNKCVKKPFNQEYVFRLILSLYSKEIKEEFGEDKIDKDFKRDFISHVEERIGIKVDDLKNFSGIKVLVVEDNEINQKMISTVLQRAGIYVDIASNGEEAIKILKNKGSSYYDIVLMDINMPIMDGFTATRKIRELKNMQKLPIVSLTALVLEHEIEKMKECGMDAFLPKPINVGKLYTILDKFVGRAGDEKSRARRSESSSEKIDGLDINTGLNMSGGNPIFYKEVLREFLAVYGESANAAKNLYQQHKLEAIKQLMLDVMGLSGTIGAKDLYTTANEVYKLFLYNKLSLLPEFIDNYTKEMDRVKRAIETYLKEE